MRTLLAAVLAALLFAVPLRAQRILDPDTCLTCWDSIQHFGSTAALDGAAQLVFPKWKPWQRVLLTGVVIGGVYEAGQLDVAYNSGLSGQRGYGFGFKDLLCDVLGAVAAELIGKALR